MPNTFTIGRVNLRYVREFFNECYQNERSVEVALGRWFIDRYIGPQIIAGSVTSPLEVGCVMPYYGNAEHEIVDIDDRHPRNRKADALKEDLRGRNLLSISSVEHMSSREYGNQSDQDCITFLRKVTTEASAYLVTWGVGYNTTLDAWVKAQPAATVPRVFLKRTSWKNTYEQVSESDEVWSTLFGHSDRPPIPGGFNNANVVVVVTNVPELLATKEGGQ